MKNAVDCKGNTLEATRRGNAHLPLACEHDASRVRTIGRLWYSKRTFSWAVRYELRGDMAVKPLDGCRFEPVEQA